MKRKADQDQIRQQNRGIILQTLRRHGPLARIELGHRTRLSPATVTAITSDLLEEELIVRAGGDEPKAPQARGRPRALLSLNPDAAYAVVGRLSVDTMDLALVNFAGEIQRNIKVGFDSSNADKKTFPPNLVAAIDRLLQETSIRPEQVREIGLGAQGAVETGTGVVAWSPAFSGRKVPIVKPLSEAFDANCCISNDTNMITEALHWSDPERYSGTFTVIMLDYGVGMGLYLNDQLFSGASGTAAEFGHANHIPGGALCRCGKKGCLEAYLSDYALVRAATNLPEHTDPKDVPVDINSLPRLIEAAHSGNEDAVASFHKAGQVLGYGIARVIAMFDPKRIVLTGAAVRAYSFMEKGMCEGLEEALVTDLRNNFELDVMPWDEDFIRSGLIAQAMTRLDNNLVGVSSPPVGTAIREEITG